MSKSSDIFIDRWKEIRKKGRFAYALKQGAILAVIVTVIKSLLKLRYLKFSKIIQSFNLIGFITLFVIAILGYYVIMWWIYENQYHIKTKQNDKN